MTMRTPLFVLVTFWPFFAHQALPASPQALQITGINRFQSQSEIKNRQTPFITHQIPLLFWSALLFGDLIATELSDSLFLAIDYHRLPRKKVLS
ncbi:MAG: hypothetical protein KUF72_10885 [Candidatus Thiodiazotropha sp. (ex Ctena orbiculata)]|nr:hypothetical protein [Candidatus Thiodiazotropha taylori]